MEHTGLVVHVGTDFVFMTSETLPKTKIYARTNQYPLAGSITTGSKLRFEVLSSDSEGARAKLLGPVQDGRAGAQTLADEGPALPVNDRLFQWAHLGSLPDVLRDLREKALPERWEFQNTAPDPKRPLPILLSYILNTFGRLVLEEKIVISDDASHAAFNTGLVDRRYEPIYALFKAADLTRWRWQLNAFCIAGEGSAGQNLVRYFNPLPLPPHYFDEPSDLLYDTAAGEPEMDWRHVVIDRVDRYPAEFLEDHWPKTIERIPTSGLGVERIAYWRSVGEAIESDNRTYRAIMNRVRDAVDLAIKRTAWNFKTAVPQYYPKIRRLQLLLPICLVSDELADMALTVEKTPSGNYLGHTVLPLDWAYKNARLVCRPDSDWLAASEIAEGNDSEQLANEAVV